MDFKAAVISYFAKYADFSGRAVRSEYWYIVPFLFITSIVLAILDTVLFPDLIIGPLGSIFAFATIIPSLSIAARRLHDIDKSGWMMLVGLIPLIGWAFLIYWLTRPSGGPNRFDVA